MSKEAKVEPFNVSNNNKLKEDVEMVFGTPESPKSDLKPAVHHVNERRQGNGSPNRRNQRETDEPLLSKPPLADIESLDDKPKDAAPFSEGDEGLHRDIHSSNNGKTEDGDADLHPDDAKALDIGGEDGNWHGHDETDFYYGDGYIANGIHTRAGEGDRPGSPVFSVVNQIIPDVNTYQQKKNLAQGMMDLALLSANANQLRYVLETRTSHPYYYPSLVFISCSVILQIAVGVGLILNSRYNVKDESDICKADKINNMTVLGIFLITIVNVFITSFSVADRIGDPAVNAGV